MVGLICNWRPPREWMAFWPTDLYNVRLDWRPSCGRQRDTIVACRPSCPCQDPKRTTRPTESNDVQENTERNGQNGCQQQKLCVASRTGPARPLKNMYTMALTTTTTGCPVPVPEIKFFLSFFSFHKTFFFNSTKITFKKKERNIYYLVKESVSRVCSPPSPPKHFIGTAVGL